VSALGSRYGVKVGVFAVLYNCPTGFGAHTAFCLIATRVLSRG